MVKLATAREFRSYGTRGSCNRCEYINAGLYVFATFVLILGFLFLQYQHEAYKSGLVLQLIGIGFIALVNAHDLFAHLAGIDYYLALLGFDLQLGLVEFTAPVLHLFGSILMFIGVLMLLIQKERGSYGSTHNHGLGMLISGPVFWLFASILDACQIYERADGHVQILQKSVQIPFLFGILLFLVGGIFNRHDVFMAEHHDYDFNFMGRKWIWLGMSGSLLFLIGGLMNVVKVFKTQKIDGMRLEKLRGGAQERLSLRQRREGHAPLISSEENR